MFLAHGFVDGKYLRKVAGDAKLSLPNPRALVEKVLDAPQIRSWCSDVHTHRNIRLARTIYYDGWPDEDTESQIGPEVKEAWEANLKELKGYWEAIEIQSDTELGFGSIRGQIRKGRPGRQKGVDTLIAVDMLVGAFTNLFSVAVLVAGDADFVPVCERGKAARVMVVVAGANDGSLSGDLKRAADRFFLFQLAVMLSRFFA